MGSKGSNQRYSKNGEMTAEGLQHLGAVTPFRKDEIIDWYNELYFSDETGNLNGFIKLCQKVAAKQKQKMEDSRMVEFIYGSISGNPDFVRLLELACNWYSGDDVKRLCILFDACDRNHNGMIGKSALKRLLAVRSAASDSATLDALALKAKEILRQADENKDNRLTRSEFINACLANRVLKQMILNI